MMNRNRLSGASSPYLRQHATNPVDWYEWGDEALSKARSENKPLLISIGYAACHWCHVMAHESFEDPAIAAIMNRYFVCIKVDREERPDIDQIYMDAAHLTTGRGGWPLNAFALPDGRPFYASTYYPKGQWIQLLEKLNDLFLNDKPQILKAAVSLTEGIRSNEIVKEASTRTFIEEDYLFACKNHLQRIDFDLGGYGSAPKFMMPVGLKQLLQAYALTDEPQLLKAVTVTLDAMARGGIYDQIGGGFSRYSTDERWVVPHFEKMLYDNAQLISLYSQAYRMTQKERYREIVFETIEFVERELLDESGGIYASIDADSEHEEGKFYVWYASEFDEIVDNASVRKYYEIKPLGNWEEGKNILFSTKDKVTFAEENNLLKEEFDSILEIANRKLLDARSKRIRPTTDDKILTSWNALMLSGYIDSYKAFGEPSFLKRALRTAHFLETKMIKADCSLWRVYKDGKVSIDAFLDDYALLSTAFASLYEITFDIKWLKLSQQMTTYVFTHFASDDSPLFYYTSDTSENLIVRKYELSDNVIPASNSVMANLIFRLGHLVDRSDYLDHAEKMTQQVRNETLEHGVYYAGWASLIGEIVYPNVEVAILGDNALKWALSMQRNYLANSLFAGGTEENLPLLKNRFQKGKNSIYICKNKSCQLPVYSVEDALEAIRRK